MTKYPNTQSPNRQQSRRECGCRLCLTRIFSSLRVRYRLRRYLLVLGIWVFGYLGVCEADQVPASILDALRAELASVTQERSSVTMRRACKQLIREADEHLQALPDAKNRYALMGILLDARKRLLALETTEQNRLALFALCERLQDAPDAYADMRLEADVLLSERDLAAGNATVATRIKVLKSMLTRYRGTSAEWKSLMIGSMIATKLFDFDLEKQIDQTMVERFAGDHKVIAFRRRQAQGTEIHVRFSGDYLTADGQSISFPIDRLGLQYVVFFWSVSTPHLDAYFQAIKDMQRKHPDAFEVYSFNVDERPDAGRQYLDKHRLDAIAMQLPGGRKHSAYLAYAQRDPDALLVNGQGHAIVQPVRALSRALSVDDITEGVWEGAHLPTIASRLDDARYLAQLRYLFNGAFLLPPLKSESVPNETLQAIRQCFVEPPSRYRMTAAAEQECYRQAEKCCTEAMEAHAESPDIGLIINARILARLGRWNSECDINYLELAKRDAEAILALDTPFKDTVVADFCLALMALRDGRDPETVLDELVSAEPTPARLVAASILAIAANARTAHMDYCGRLQALEPDRPLWSACALLRDKHHRYRHFFASPGGNGYSRPQKYAYRHMVSGLLDPVGKRQYLAIELDAPSGGTFTVPDDALTTPVGVIFAEPPVDVTAQSNLVSRVNVIAGSFQNTPVVVAVIASKTNNIKAFIDGVSEDCKVGVLPGGLDHPVVQRLGILSADRVPNPFLLRADGSVAWSISGLEYRFFGDRNPLFAIAHAIPANLEKINCDQGFEALDKGDYALSLTLLDAYQAPRRHDYWAADRLHAKALAYMGQENWDAALKDIEAAIAQRRNDFKSAMCKCHGIVEMLLTKAMILDAMGRNRDAIQARREAQSQNLPHAKLPPGLARESVPIGVYYEWLKQIRLSLGDR
jgi:hypothetical protein